MVRYYMRAFVPWVFVVTLQHCVTHRPTPAGAAPTSAMWQRINVVHILRQLCEDSQLLYFLFVTYDVRWEVHLNAVQALIKCLASIVESYGRGGPDLMDDDSHLAALAHAFQSIQSKAHGVIWCKISRTVMSCSGSSSDAMHGTDD